MLTQLRALVSVLQQLSLYKNVDGETGVYASSVYWSTEPVKHPLDLCFSNERVREDLLQMMRKDIQ
jgi:hypothetical protein